MKDLIKTHTWELIKLPLEKRIVGCRWVYIVKYIVDGTHDKYKARLVAKGYTQSQGIDYFATFAHVAKFNTVRIRISLASKVGWKLCQYDAQKCLSTRRIERRSIHECTTRI